MSSENLRMITLPEMEISNVNLISVRKWVNNQTYRHTRNLKLFGARVHTSEKGLQKI